MYIEKEMCYKELAHVVMEAGKSQLGVWAGVLETQEKQVPV